jgi:hypothetical protein
LNSFPVNNPFFLNEASFLHSSFDPVHPGLSQCFGIFNLILQGIGGARLLFSVPQGDVVDLDFFGRGKLNPEVTSGS